MLVELVERGKPFEHGNELKLAFDSVYSTFNCWVQTLEILGCVESLKNPRRDLQAWNSCPTYRHIVLHRQSRYFHPRISDGPFGSFQYTCRRAHGRTGRTLWAQIRTLRTATNHRCPGREPLGVLVSTCGQKRFRVRSRAFPVQARSTRAGGHGSFWKSPSGVDRSS